jgi:NNP family nitrate/nitrite transporter-like MFS transporter
MYTGANSWLPSYFHEQFQVSTVVAGTLISVGLVLGAFARPSGGFVADKIQKKIILIFSVLMLAVFYSVIGLGLNITLSFVAVIIVAWFVMFGAGALFRIPPLLFDKEVGTVVGMASTFGLFLGGFVMPPIEGFLIDTTHSYASVFYLLGIISLINIIGAIKIKQV